MRIVSSSSTGHLFRLGHPINVKIFKTLFYKSTATRMYTFKEVSTLIANIEACLAASVDIRSLSCRRTSSVYSGTRTKKRIQIYYKPVATLKVPPSPIPCSMEGRVTYIGRTHLFVVLMFLICIQEQH